MAILRHAPPRLHLQRGRRFPVPTGVGLLARKLCGTFQVLQRKVLQRNMLQLNRPRRFVLRWRISRPSV